MLESTDDVTFGSVTTDADISGSATSTGSFGGKLTISWV